MTQATIAAAPAAPARGDVLAIGFGTAVAMWTFGYSLRLPPAPAPGQALLGTFLALHLAGGYLAGRLGSHGWRGGLYVGLLTAGVNLLILGSLLGGPNPNQVRPSALWWLPGSLLVGALLGAGGAAIGVTLAGRGSPLAETAGSHRDRNWTAVLAGVTAVATFALLVIGGIVTASEAGLAVVDWPNSYGYNMFLYPLSRMTGGIYYEHAHRLFGALVGLTTLVLALHLQRADPRRWVRRLALGALALVIAQGILGGLRVTGRFTLSDSPLDTAPNLLLAIAHGVTGQLFFATVVALAVVTTSTWRSGPPPRLLASAGTDRALARWLVGLIVGQLVLGAVLRHVQGGLLVHVSFAVVVTLAALACGVRAWGLHTETPIVSRLGRLLLALLACQIMLGIGALVVTGQRAGLPLPSASDVIVTTAHQAVGAMLLATAVGLAAWLQRLIAPAGGNVLDTTN